MTEAINYLEDKTVHLDPIVRNKILQKIEKNEEHPLIIKEFADWCIERKIFIIDERIWKIFHHDYYKKIREMLKDRREEERQSIFVTRNIPKQTRYEVLKSQKWRCNQCNKILTFSKKSPWEGETAHIDHIHPFANRMTYPKGPGYINERSNLQALCPSCNLKKQKKQS